MIDICIKPLTVTNCSGSRLVPWEWQKATRACFFPGGTEGRCSLQPRVGDFGNANRQGRVRSPTFPSRSEQQHPQSSGQFPHPTFLLRISVCTSCEFGSCVFQSLNV